MRAFLYILILVVAGCQTSQHIPAITVKKDEMAHHAVYRVYSDSAWVHTLSYYGADSVSEKKVINDYLKDR